MRDGPYKGRFASLLRFATAMLTVLLACNALADGCVAAADGGGTTPAGEPCEVASNDSNQIPPAPPLLLTASDGTFDNRVELTWTEAPGADTYNVYVSDTPQSPLTFIGQTSATFARIRGTGPGIVTTFWVFSENQFGESFEGVYDTGFVAISATPAPPTAVVATDGTFADRIRISWSDVAGETYYQLFRCTTPLGETCGEPIHMPEQDTTSHDDMQASADGSLAYYRMKACNENGCSNFSAANSGFRRVPKSDMIFKHGFE